MYDNIVFERVYESHIQSGHSFVTVRASPVRHPQDYALVESAIRGGYLSILSKFGGNPFESHDSDIQVKIYKSKTKVPGERKTNVQVRAKIPPNGQRFTTNLFADELSDVVSTVFGTPH